jgi:hypothetical protein
MIRFICAVQLFCALVLVQCSRDPLSGNGGSSETVNASVILLDTTVSVAIDNPLVNGIEIHSYSPVYRPFEKRGFADHIAVEDSSTLTWQAPAQGTFSLLIKISPNGNACYLPNIMLQKGTDDTIRCALARCRDLSGTIVTLDSAAAQDNYSLSIFGTPFFAATDAGLGFTLKNLPAGNFLIVVQPIGKDYLPKSVYFRVEIDSVRSFSNFKVVMPENVFQP